MIVGGVQQFTLSDFPGRVAAIVFTQGCNFRCPYCHNGVLIPFKAPEALIPEDDVIRFLKSRQKQLDGLVISGGEPTLQADLAAFIYRIKSLGLRVKLDTNGSQPEVIRCSLREGLLDFVAMDIKAPLHAYERLTGVPIETSRILESIALIAQSGVAHEFRTTAVPQLLPPPDLQAIKELIPPGSRHRLQTFCPDNALDLTLRAPQKSDPRHFLKD